MEICSVVSKRSKDQNTQIGCVIVDPESRSILTTGYNSFIRGINDYVLERQERPLKYKYFEHAERNAIYNAARNGVRLHKSHAYINAWTPCSDCMRALLQSGISTIYTQVNSSNIADIKLFSEILPDRYLEDAFHSVTQCIEHGSEICEINTRRCLNTELLIAIQRRLNSNSGMKETFKNYYKAEE